MDTEYSSLEELGEFLAEQKSRILPESQLLPDDIMDMHKSALSPAYPSCLYTISNGHIMPMINTDSSTLEDKCGSSEEQKSASFIDRYKALPIQTDQISFEDFDKLLDELICELPDDPVSHHREPVGRRKFILLAEQKKALERRFQQSRYLSREEMAQLSRRLGLDRGVVRDYFQSKRNTEKKETKTKKRHTCP